MSRFFLLAVFCAAALPDRFVSGPPWIFPDCLALRYCVYEHESAPVNCTRIEFETDAHKLEWVRDCASDARERIEFLERSWEKVWTNPCELCMFERAFNSHFYRAEKEWEET